MIIALSTGEAAQLMLSAAAEIGTPILIAAVITGLFASVIQALVQLQEASLGLLARAGGVVGVIVWKGGELLETLLEVTRLLFMEVAR